MNVRELPALQKLLELSPADRLEAARVLQQSALADGPLSPTLIAELEGMIDNYDQNPETYLDGDLEVEKILTELRAGTSD